MKKLKDKARREVRDRTDVGSSAPSSFAAEVKISAVNDMDEMCMVMCGAWLCGSDGKWEFVVDKTNMARMIPVHEALTIKEFKIRVFAEFKKSETSFNIVLSYWPPDSKELATGIKPPPPPVLLTSDGALRYFFSHMKVTGSLNLFATFEIFGYGTAAPDMDGFETPRCSTKQRESGNKRKTVDLSSLIEDVEKIEERLRSESNTTGGGDCNGMSDGIDSDYKIDERDVRPRGYDVEFWEPLIDGDLGGSNAVEVVFNEKEANGVGKLSEGSRSEPVGGSSGGSGLKGEIPVDDYAWMGRTNFRSKRCTLLMQIDEMCMVMCGAWLCGSDGKWEFVVDKTNMARMIPVVHEALTIKEFEIRCLAIGRRTARNLQPELNPPPPVLLTSDGALRYFFSHMKVTGSLNLFATFESFGYGTAAPDMDGFETPRCSTKQRESGNKRKTVDLSSLIEDVEKIEERLRSESNTTGGGDCNGMSDGIDSDYSGPEEIDERDVRPRGYDVELWEPLIDGDLGGSNAEEVVFNEKEANGVGKLSEGSRSEPVGGSSGGNGLKGEIPVDDYAWMGRTSIISPIGDPRDEYIPDNVRDATLMPPLTKRPP
ncbi:hypothetical protein HID58_087405 [Brassica napus]|uniref:Uncharacterized protein n=1 Tax=Brassica napus TaxID=3708 RepID=A0ABQ7XT62_BRANA|nr:hypothetical protein HID58_087405 [Brassica napus]